ncbi:MAG: GAF domain-containing protein, partial [Anaerolineae bacterium]|nr:GAF domain-containing protein [Anaerolineae bacterium]
MLAGLGLLAFVLLALPFWSGVAHAWGVWLVYTVLYVLAAVRQTRQPLPDGDWFGFQLLPLLAVLGTFGGLAVLALVIGALLAGVLEVARDFRSHQSGREMLRHLLGRAIYEISTLGLALFVGTAFLLGLGGALPFDALTWADVPALVGLLLGAVMAHSSLQLLLAGGVSQRVWLKLARRVMAETALVAPAIILAFVYYRLDRLEFALLLGTVCLLLLRLHRTGLARRQMEEQAAQLLTLQDLGETLVDALTPAEACEAIYRLVATRLDVPLFYIAMADRAQQTISFPLVAEAGVPLKWPSRAWDAAAEAAPGPVEYILRKGEALFLPDDCTRRARLRGIDGGDWIEPCASFLAAPVTSRETVFGVIAMQHPTRPRAYTP